MTNSPHNASKKSKGPLIAGVLALVVLVAGIGAWALTRDAADKNKAITPVEGFFGLLNSDSPGYSDFSEFATSIDTLNVVQATNSSPGGTYTVVSIGDPVDDAVTVTWTHQGKEFTSQFQLQEVDRAWKLVKPFAYATVTAAEKVRFRLGPHDQNGVMIGEQQAYYPGRYTIAAMGQVSTADTASWEATTPTLDLLPGEIRTIELVPTLTEAAATRIRTTVSDAFTACLASDALTPPGGCPNRVTHPANAAFPPKAVWTLTPADAATKATYVAESGVIEPCFQITGTLGHTYALRAGGTATGTPVEITAKGCIHTAFDQDRVTWTK